MGYLVILFTHLQILTYVKVLLISYQKMYASLWQCQTVSIPSLMGSKDVTSEKAAAIFVPDLGATA